MIEFRRPGPKTFQYDNVRHIFEEHGLKKQLYNINKNFLALNPELGLSNLKIQLHDSWTELGPAGEGRIIVGNYIIKFGCFRNGWHIELSDRLGYVDDDVKIYIFGDINRTMMWTPTTDKVVEILDDLYKCLKEMGEV